VLRHILTLVEPRAEVEADTVNRPLDVRIGLAVVGFGRLAVRSEGRVLRVIIMDVLVTMVCQPGSILVALHRPLDWISIGNEERGKHTIRHSIRSISRIIQSQN
jgi:hypothetical protein